MAILVLVLWLFTAGAGFSVLISSNLKHDRSAPAAQPALAAARTPARNPSPSASDRDAKRARREQFDPASLVAARNAPVLPGARALLEFTHPACGIIGLAFWLGYSLVHARLLGLIGFGLAVVTACAGLTWFTVNVRAARRQAGDARGHAHGAPAEEAPAPSFRGRLVALHGAAAALTVVLATLTALVLHG